MCLQRLLAASTNRIDGERGFDVISAFALSAHSLSQTPEGESVAELKTKPGTLNVADFLKTVKDEHRRKECRTILDMMRKATGAEPVMWGSSIVGFGHYHYVYDSGREGDWFITGFSPRKGSLTVYLMGGLTQNNGLLDRLGKCKAGKGCLYIHSLKDVHLPTLQKLIQSSVKYVRGKTR